MFPTEFNVFPIQKIVFAFQIVILPIKNSGMSLFDATTCVVVTANFSWLKLWEAVCPEVDELAGFQ